MEWEVEYTDQFGQWWDTLGEAEQISIRAVVGLLEELGPQLAYPYSSDIRGSRYGQMRELRIQHQGCPVRVLYAFDPRRTAILLIGGEKTGMSDARFYGAVVPIAERLYEQHLDELRREGLYDG